jgi:hypothetical protein
VLLPFLNPLFAVVALPPRHARLYAGGGLTAPTGPR